MARLAGVDEASLTGEQREVRRVMMEKRNGFLPKPHEIWSFRPEMANYAQELGVYFNHCSLPARLVELAMLMVGRHWRAGYAWETHLPRARKAGLSEAVLTALAEERAPAFTAEDETLVYDFVTGLLAARRVDDALFERAMRVLGRDGVVDLTGLVGYFSMVSVTVKAFEL